MSRHGDPATQPIRHPHRARRRLPGGLWWKVLVVIVLLWALGRFGGPAPTPPPVCPAPAQPGAHQMTYPRELDSRLAPLDTHPTATPTPGS